MRASSSGASRRAREARGARARAAAGGLSVDIDATEVGFLADRLVMVEPRFHAMVRPRLRAAGQDVRDLAARNASWSTRIPAALRVRVALKGDRPGVYVSADAGRAPHARPFEALTGRDPFPHPVFGGPAWVTQAARPFLLPALRARQAQVQQAISDAVDDAFRAAGVT